MVRRLLVIARMKLSILLISLSLGVAACDSPLKYDIVSSTSAPGADAKIVAEVKKYQGLTQLEIVAANLPPPARVSDAATAYVVWHRKDASGAWGRLGGLAYDESNRKGKWNGSVPETSFDLAISAENQGDVVSPSGKTVFSQRVN